MQRGVLVLNKEELIQLLTVLDISKFNGLPLFNKLTFASNTPGNEVKILVSEDEIEKILDEVGPPTYENNLANNAIKKINELLLTIRTEL